MGNNSLIINHKHNNLNVLDLLSENSSQELLFRGKKINDTEHILKSIYSEAGVHGLRYFNLKLQYYDPAASNWADISTGGGSSGPATIKLSPNKDNTLVKLSNGYYVPQFKISATANNALVKYSDGYYVQKIPSNIATTDDIDNAVTNLENKIQIQENKCNNQYTVLTNKVKEITANITNFKEHHYTGNNSSLQQVIDFNTLYDSSKVILSLEFMIKNNSLTYKLNIQIKENDIITMDDNLNEEEVQRYKLSNIRNYKFLIEGDYNLYLYVNYI